MNKISIRGKNHSGGYIVIINTLFFLAICIAIIIGVATPIISHYKSAKSFMHSKNAFLVANSATEEALYRLKNGMSISTSQTITLANGNATISIADTYQGKTVTVNANTNEFSRNIRTEIIQAVGVSFNYGLQVGKGGLSIEGGSTVTGNVYSNGKITGGNNSFITGTAVSANISDPTPNQSHGDIFPPPHEISFGGDSSPSVDIAQSFQVTTTTPISSVRLYLKKSANDSMQNINVRITNDSNSKPGKTTLTSRELSAVQVTTSYNYLTVPFTSAPVLTPGTTYWLVLDTNTSGELFYSTGASSNTYANGVAKIGSWASNNGGTWSNASPSDLDIYFDLYVGGEKGLISKITIGPNATSDAWAYEVEDSIVSGVIYCQEGTGNNKACDTSRPDPVEQPFPVSEGNIIAWKNQAQAGGVHTGDISYSSGIYYLGPQKIVGDLSINAGGVLNLTGTLWVTGAISVTGNAKMKLSSSYQENSGIVVSDGRVSGTGGGSFEGSGAPDSYILIITTSTCPVGLCGGNNPAILVSGGIGAVVLNAQKGTIEFSGGAQAKQATAEKMSLTGGSDLIYETGLANINFAGGPAGTWSINAWEEF